MSPSIARRFAGGRGRRPFAAAAVLLALAAPFVAAGPATAAPERVAATGGCRAIGSGDAPSGGGPSRATVVVDIGSGPVWSACISFSGTISGIEALERAQSVITDLDPVYDQYSGLGRAVCKLRSIGSDPPDCLGKSINSWWVSLNGRVTGVGASSLQIHDGDVEGWRYASGGAPPRAATDGTEAAAAPIVPTTTRPSTPTTQPSSATTTPSGNGTLTGSTKPDGTAVDPTEPRPGPATSTTAPGQTTTTAKRETSTTTTGGGDRTAVEAAGTEGNDASSGSDESAAGAAATDTAGATTPSDGGGGGSTPALVGFVLVIAALGGGALLVRRRRSETPTPQV